MVVFVDVAVEALRLLALQLELALALMKVGNVINNVTSTNVVAILTTSVTVAVDRGRSSSGNSTSDRDQPHEPS